MKSKIIFVFIISLAFVLAGSLSAQEKKIDKKNLPIAVLNSFQNSYPDAAIKSKSIEKENSKIYYEMDNVEKVTRDKNISYEIVDKDGRQKNEIVLDSKGNIQKVKKIKKENHENDVKENDKADTNND